MGKRMLKNFGSALAPAYSLWSRLLVYKQGLAMWMRPDKSFSLNWTSCAYLLLGWSNKFAFIKYSWTDFLCFDVYILSNVNQCKDKYIEENSGTLQSVIWEHRSVLFGVTLFVRWLVGQRVPWSLIHDTCRSCTSNTIPSSQTLFLEVNLLCDCFLHKVTLWPVSRNNMTSWRNNTDSYPHISLLSYDVPRDTFDTRQHRPPLS